MSVELPQFGDQRRTLFEYHPALRNGDSHTVSSVGRTLVSDARHNLMVYSESRYDRIGNKRVEKGFWDGFWEEAGTDYAALHLGTALQSLENALAGSGFNLVDHINLYNEGVTGIWELKRILPEDKTQSVTEQKWRDMIAAAKEDPTLSIFFNARRNLLPRQLRAFLHMAKAMPEIYKVLPSYQDYAEGVLAPYEQNEQAVKDHGMMLNYFDDLLTRLDDH